MSEFTDRRAEVGASLRPAFEQMREAFRGLAIRVGQPWIERLPYTRRLVEAEALMSADLCRWEGEGVSLPPKEVRTDPAKV